MNINVKGMLKNGRQQLDAGFFLRFTPGNAQDVFFPVAMAAKLKPSVQKFMMRQQSLPSVILTHHKGASGKMRRKAVAIKAILLRKKQLNHAFAKRLFFRGTIQVPQLPQQSRASLSHA